MSDEDFKTLVKARMKKEEVEFEKWYSEVYSHLPECEALSENTISLIKSAARNAWMKRSQLSIKI